MTTEAKIREHGTSGGSCVALLRIEDLPSGRMDRINMYPSTGKLRTSFQRPAPQSMAGPPLARYVPAAVAQEECEDFLLSYVSDVTY